MGSFDSSVVPSFDMNFSHGRNDVGSITSPKSKPHMDPSAPLLRQLKSYGAPPSEATDFNAFNASSSHAMFGAPPMTVRPTGMRVNDDTKSPMLLDSQLGNTAWLGLGGTLQHTGDAGGGSELNVLSEFLESLEDPNMARAPDLLPYASSNTDVNLSAPLPQRSSTGAILDTPPSMVGQEALPGPSSMSTGHSLGPFPPSAARPRRRTISEFLPEKLDDVDHDRYSVMTASTPTLGIGAGDSAQESRSMPYATLAKMANKTEQFLLTAADQSDGSRNERLRKVIQAKWEAGLLRPYNHVHGYARLNRWMETNVSQSSRRRILKPLSVFQPVFSALAKNLTSFDLMYIEEAFERLMLDYDRVFSIQGIPACLWRRTGEIYKGNKEFAELVGIPIESLRDGRLCIYELMAEESAVNYWEKYGSVSFDPSQKAVLTMCKLRTNNRNIMQAMSSARGHGQTAATSADVRPGSASSERTAQPDAEESGDAPAGDSACISCCFSFTIRRDKWNVRLST